MFHIAVPFEATLAAFVFLLTILQLEDIYFLAEKIMVRNKSLNFLFNETELVNIA